MNPSIDRIIEHEIDTLNDHLPMKRIPLKQLLETDDPHFITRCGDKSVFRIEEIIWLRDTIPEEFHDDICLPIVFLRRNDYGPGIYTIAGNKSELFLVHHILGYVDLEWQNFSKWNPVERLARPQVQILRQKLPSTTTIGIVLISREKTKEETLQD
ncbi:MAG: DUF61 family protein [Candidatus Thorarchaeota archaeon]|nr:DUF61 family protein [Candidatus Thorarchaeota archaeon]